VSPFSDSDEYETALIIGFITLDRGGYKGFGCYLEMV
jgi:hypothetical protein